MISGKLATGSRMLITTLGRQARRVAEAHAMRRLLARSADARRWRRADLLWPLFNRED